MTPGSAARYRRTRWLVEPKYQWRVTRLLVITLLLVAVVTLLLIYYALWSTLGELEVWPSAVFMATFRAVAWMVLVELILATPLAIAAGIYLTHKVVGPMARIKTALEHLGQGNWDIRLKLREGDVLIDLADSINRLAASLKQTRPPSGA